MQYADPKRKKYPLEATPENGHSAEQNIRNDWFLVHMPDAGNDVSRVELEEIKRRVVEAWKRKIDPKGPPSARERRPPHVNARSFASGAHSAGGKAVMAKPKSRLKALIEDIKKEAREISEMSGIPIDVVLATISHQLHGDLVDPDDPDAAAQGDDLAPAAPPDGARAATATSSANPHPHFRGTFLNR